MRCGQRSPLLTLKGRIGGRMLSDWICATISLVRHSVVPATRLERTDPVVSSAGSRAGNVRIEDERKRAELFGEVDQVVLRTEAIKKQVSAIDQAITI